VTADERPVWGAAKAFSIFLALLAPARMAWIVFTVGENNLSNDYVARVPIVVSILEGRYSLPNLFRDTWIWGGHSWLGLLPFYWLNARFFAWSTDVELGIGLFLAAAKTLLLWGAVTPALASHTGWLLLPALSTLAFSVSQVASFTFGESVLQMQLAQTALAAGAFAFARLADRPALRVTALACCGVLASWSWGGGVLAWPVFAAALFAAGERSVRRWAVLPAAAVLALSQYVWFLVIAPHRGVVRSPGLRGLPSVLGLLGRPFANGTGVDFGPKPVAVVFGVVGLVLAAAALWSTRRELRKRLPALVILGWGLFLAVQIALVRPDVAAWYIAPMTAFWLGLAVLLATAPHRLAITGFATIAAGLLYANRSWEDKSFYLASRAPASAACLREWRTAPPQCHDLVFQWGAGGYRPDELAFFGEILERRGLSVFGRRRTYLLQGDVVVGRVDTGLWSAVAFLSRDGRTPGDPNDFHRLDFVLFQNASATWRVDLPPNLTSVRFETRVRASRGEPMLARGARVAVAGEGAEARTLVPAGGREPLSLDLRPYAGRTVALRLTAEEAEGGAPLVFEAPKIELLLAR
jgi:hypothetical protein